jgi:hypothetical protein
MRLAFCLLLPLSVVLAPPSALAAPPEPQWQFGVATARITPERPQWMAGYASRSRPAEGALHDLWAKVLVLQDRAGQRAALVTLDLVGIDREFSTSLATAIHLRHGLERSRLALCSSHTHSGPVVGYNLRPLHYDQLPPVEQEQIRRYSDQLAQTLVNLVGQALDKLAPCRLDWGLGEAPFAVNRRQNPEPQVPDLRQAGQLRGPVDHRVPVLRVAGADGHPRAVVFGYACHATVLDGYQWSGDYPGYAQLELERRLPGCVALFWAGCGGDQNPLPRRQVALAERYGRELAEAAQAVLARPLHPISPQLATAYQEIDLPLGELPTAEQLRREADSDNRYLAGRARRLLEQLDSGTPLSPCYPYPIQAWRLGGELDWLFLGGEVVVDYALRLQAESGSRPAWVAAYANDVMAYIPSRRVLLEGGYEGATAMVYYGLPAPWAPTVEEVLVRGVHTTLGRLPSRPPLPPP